MVRASQIKAVAARIPEFRKMTAEQHEQVAQAVKAGMSSVRIAGSTSKRLSRPYRAELSVDGWVGVSGKLQPAQLKVDNGNSSWEVEYANSGGKSTVREGSMKPMTSQQKATVDQRLRMATLDVDDVEVRALLCFCSASRLHLLHLCATQFGFTRVILARTLLVHQHLLLMLTSVTLHIIHHVVNARLCRVT